MLSGKWAVIVGSPESETPANIGNLLRKAFAILLLR